VTLAQNKHGETIGFAGFITVSRWDADKGFEACTACASVGLHTKLSTTTFRAIFWCATRFAKMRAACTIFAASMAAKPSQVYFIPRSPRGSDEAKATGGGIHRQSIKWYIPTHAKGA